MLLTQVMANGFQAPPPPSGMVWAGAFACALSSGDTVATSTRNEADTSPEYGHAYTAALPGGSVYMEVEIVVDNTVSPQCAAGLWAPDSPFDEGQWIYVGGFSGRSIGALNDAGSSGFVLNTSDYIDGFTDFTPNDYPVLRYGIAFEGSSRTFYIRLVRSAGQSQWIDSDPDYGGGVVGLGGAHAPRLCVSLTQGSTGQIIAPSNHYKSPPTGYTAI